MAREAMEGLDSETVNGCEPIKGPDSQQSACNPSQPTPAKIDQIDDRKIRDESRVTA